VHKINTKTCLIGTEAEEQLTLAKTSSAISSQLTNCLFTQLIAHYNCTASDHFIRLDNFPNFSHQTFSFSLFFERSKNQVLR